MIKGIRLFLNPAHPPELDFSFFTISATTCTANFLFLFAATLPVPRENIPLFPVLEAGER